MPSLILDYFFDKFEKGRADKYIYGKSGNKIGQFDIREGDIELFPCLENIEIIFIYPWRSMLSIHRDTIDRKRLF